MSGLTITVIRRGDQLIPAAEMFREDLRAIPENQEVVISLRRARSPKHLRFFFAKLRSLIKAGAWDNDQASLLDYIKIGIGHVITVVDNSSTMVSGTILSLAEGMVQKYGQASDEGRLARFVISIAGPKSYLVPKSISFESLSQDEFNDFDRRSDRFIAERFGIDPEQLRATATEAAGGPLETDAAQAAPIEPEPEEPAPETDTPLDERLRAVAFELGIIEGGINATEKHWLEMKQRPDLKSLDSQARDILRELIAAAREKARGNLTEGQFKRMVESIAAKAAPRSEAA